MDKLTLARKRASKVRAGWLMGVADGLFTIEDVLNAYPAEPAVGRIRLTQLLAAQPGVGKATAEHIVGRFRRFASHRYSKTKKVPNNPTVSYVRHSQAGEAFREAWDDARAIDPPWSPWEGFPHV